jgi:hypothetical protein
MASPDAFNYQDTAQTPPWRDELRRLNIFLAEANIDFIDDGREPRVDPFNRLLARHFTVLEGQEVRFDQHGRLHGGSGSISRRNGGETSA